MTSFAQTLLYSANINSIRTNTTDCIASRDFESYNSDTTSFPELFITIESSPYSNGCSIATDWALSDFAQLSTSAATDNNTNEVWVLGSATHTIGNESQSFFVGLTGRYVGVELISTNELNIEEMQLMSCFCDELMNSTLPICRENNGTLTFDFANNPSQTGLEFSLNGGFKLDCRVEKISNKLNCFDPSIDT